MDEERANYCCELLLSRCHIFRLDFNYICMRLGVILTKTSGSSLVTQSVISNLSMSRRLQHRIMTVIGKGVVLSVLFLF